MAHPSLSENHYIRLSISPPSDALTLRKSLQDSLTQSFGITSSTTYLDILWVADDGGEAVVRVKQGDAIKTLAAVVASTSPRMSLVKESPFLPSLLSNNTSL